MIGPRTKRSISPFRLPNGDILLARDVFGLGQRLRRDTDGRLWTLLGLMDGTRDVGSIARAARRRHPGLRESDVRRAIARLEAIGVVEPGGPPDDGPAATADDGRHSRNLDFFSLVTLGTPRPSREIQARLRAARVTVLGMGAIGTTTALSLAAAGVGHLRIIDPDRVETSNLNRQTLYRNRDVGRLKVEAAAEHLRELDPELRVTIGTHRVSSPGDLPRLLRGCDLFVLGADQPHEILLWTNDAALRSGTPWLDNSYSGPRCAIALFVPGRTPCLRCLQHQLERRQRSQGVFDGSLLVPEPAANAVIAPTAGIAGHYGALRALYFLAGLRSQDEGGLLQVNLWRPDDVRFVGPRYWRDCPACGRGRASR